MMFREHAHRQHTGASFRQPIDTIRPGFVVRAIFLRVLDPQYAPRDLTVEARIPGVATGGKL